MYRLFILIHGFFLVLLSIKFLLFFNLLGMRKRDNYSHWDNYTMGNTEKKQRNHTQNKANKSKINNFTGSNKEKNYLHSIKNFIAPNILAFLVYQYFCCHLNTHSLRFLQHPSTVSKNIICVPKTRTNFWYPNKRVISPILR